MTTTTPPEPAEGSQPSTAKQRYWWVVGTAAATTVALLLGMWWADGLVLWLGIAVVAGGYFFVIGVPSSVAVAISNRWWVRLASAAVIVCAAFWVGWTTGTSEDAQAGLIVLTLPMVGVPLAGLVLVAEQVHAARSQPWGGKSSEVDVEVVELPPRLAAFLIDAVLVFAVQIVPGDLLQDRELTPWRGPSPLP